MSFDIKTWSGRRERELGLARFYVYEKANGLWRLDMIAVPKGRQGEGIGSRVMEELVDLADTHGKTIVLQTGERDDRWGTTSKARLERFYKRFGFVANKGAKKDFLVSESMYRRPRRARNPDEADLAWLLLPPGEWPGIGSEKGGMPSNGIARYVSPHGSYRYVLYQHGEPIAGLQVVDGSGLATVANVYTLPSHRHMRHASVLFDRARTDFPNLEHAKHTTKAGREWIARKQRLMR